MEQSKRGFIPMSHGVSLFKKNSPKTEAEKAVMNKVPYASAVGSIMYAVRCTRHDVAFAQNLTSRYQQNPGELH